MDPRLAALGPHVGAHIRAVGPALHDALLTTMRSAMSAQGRSLAGGQGRGLALGVRTAVDAFVETVADPGRDLAGTRAVFHELGRTEYREGHRVDALRSVLTVGARGAWAFLVDHAPLSPDELYVLAGALFGFVDTIAGAAAEGYLDEQQDSAQDWATTRRRLVTLLVQADPPADDVLHAAAEAARWPLPATVAVAAVDGTDADHLARAVGNGTLATVIGDVIRLVVPDPHTPGRAAQLQRALAGRRAAVGPAVPLGRARVSYRLAGRGLRLADGVLVCDEHLLTLLTGWEPGLTDRLTARALAPLDGLSPAVARTLAETLLAWLRCQGQVIPTAQALHAHPQTVRYRMRRLRTLYGARLDHPDARLELHLALHHHLRP